MVVVYWRQKHSGFHTGWQGCKLAADAAADKLCVQSDACDSQSWRKLVTAALEPWVCTHSSNLLATAVAFGVGQCNLKMVGEVVIVCWCELIEEFFCRSRLVCAAVK